MYVGTVCAAFCLKRYGAVRPVEFMRDISLAIDYSQFNLGQSYLSLFCLALLASTSRVSWCQSVGVGLLADASHAPRVSRARLRRLGRLKGNRQGPSVRAFRRAISAIDAGDRSWGRKIRYFHDVTMCWLANKRALPGPTRAVAAIISS